MLESLMLLWIIARRKKRFLLPLTKASEHLSSSHAKRVLILLKNFSQEFRSTIRFVESSSTTKTTSKKREQKDLSKKSKIGLLYKNFRFLRSSASTLLPIEMNYKKHAANKSLRHKESRSHLTKRD